jgi:hypothetical protein
MPDMSTSSSGVAKVYRAISHIENAERLIASLPAIYWEGKERRAIMRALIQALQDIADRARKELQVTKTP